MRRTFGALVAVMLLLITAACGDDDAGTDPGVSDPPPTAAATDDGTATDDSEGAAGDVDMDDGDMMGASYADLTFDGTTVRFAASGLTYSPIEGVDDITLEECDPSFFGAGLWVIAYPVDANGELVVADEFGNLSGGFTAVFPFPDTSPDLMQFEFDVDYDPLGIDARFREGPGPTYSFDGNRVSGTVTLDNLNTDPVEVAFDVVCAG